jgi:hygromycin-B 7''-O-kinase
MLLPDAASIIADYKASRESLAAIARQYGVTAENVRPLPSGVANDVFYLGDGLVLRIPRTTQFLVDPVKETAVIPAARDAGVRTPTVIAFDDTCSEVNVPCMVLTRAPGVDLAQLALSTAETQHVFHQVGQELAKLHRISPTAAAGLGAIPADDDATDSRALTLLLLAEGWIDADTSRWLTGWIDRLSTHRPPDPPQVLLHGDIAPQNLLASPNNAQLTGIVDWGDAQWADPAIKFAKTPLTGIPAMLDGYRQENGEAVSPTTRSWEARVLWIHLTWALARLPNPTPNPGARHWIAPPASRLLGLLHFFSSSPPAPWAELT